MKNVIAAAIFSLFSFAHQANAACVIPPGYSFFVAQNDTVTYNPTTDALGCTHRFTSNGSTAFTSSAIVSKPSNGSLEQTGEFTFRYKPKAGYKGKDAYAVKICGTNQSGSGCSTIKYDATVQ